MRLRVKAPVHPRDNRRCFHGSSRDAPWLERAQSLSIEDLSRELKSINPGEAPRTGSANAGLPGITLRIPAAEVPPEVYAKWEQARRKLEDAAGRSLPHAEILDAMLDAVLAAPAGRPLEYAVHINKCSHCEHASVETEDGHLLEWRRAGRVTFTAGPARPEAAC